MFKCIAKRSKIIFAAVANMPPYRLFGEVRIPCVAIGSTSDSCQAFDQPGHLKLQQGLGHRLAPSRLFNLDFPFGRRPDTLRATSRPC